MNLIFGNKIIDTPIIDIIEQVRSETGGKYFSMIGKPGRTNLQVQCPYHKAGQEHKMSASFFIDQDDPELEYGFFKCFTCGEAGPLYTVINHCFGKDKYDEFGKNWLINNFGKIIGETRLLPSVDFTKKKDERIILDEAVLNDYNYIHPYMYKRCLTNDVIAKYKIGYDLEAKAITFPCWDKAGNLVAINRRSVENKHFKLADTTNKEVYLLNFALKENASTLYIMESQINALSFMSKFPDKHAVALLGTGTQYQYNILKKCGIRSFVLGLDADPAGEKGTERFIKNIKNCMISIMDIPDGLDVNDMICNGCREFPVLTIDEWRLKHNKHIVENYN